MTWEGYTGRQLLGFALGGIVWAYLVVVALRIFLSIPA